MFLPKPIAKTGRPSTSDHSWLAMPHPAQGWAPGGGELTPTYLLWVVTDAKLKTTNCQDPKISKIQDHHQLSVVTTLFLECNCESAFVHLLINRWYGSKSGSKDSSWIILAPIVLVFLAVLFPYKTCCKLTLNKSRWSPSQDHYLHLLLFRVATWSQPPDGKMGTLKLVCFFSKYIPYL